MNAHLTPAQRIERRKLQEEAIQLYEKETQKDKRGITKTDLTVTNANFKVTEPHIRTNEGAKGKSGSCCHT